MGGIDLIVCCYRRQAIVRVERARRDWPSALFKTAWHFLFPDQRTAPEVLPARQLKKNAFPEVRRTF